MYLYRRGRMRTYTDGIRIFNPKKWATIYTKIIAEAHQDTPSLSKWAPVARVAHTSREHTHRNTHTHIRTHYSNPRTSERKRSRVEIQEKLAACCKTTTVTLAHAQLTMSNCRSLHFKAQSKLRRETTELISIELSPDQGSLSTRMGHLVCMRHAFIKTRNGITQMAA